MEIQTSDYDRSNVNRLLMALHHKETDHLPHKELWVTNQSDYEHVLERKLDYKIGDAAEGGQSITHEDDVIDPLALTMGADHKAGWVTLETVKLVMREFGVNISMSTSNISCSLPDRKYVNATFIAMAILAGLTCPIANPLVNEVSSAVLAADLSLGKDEFSLR